MDRIATGVGWYLVFLFSLVAHEAAHALTAWRLGDKTAYEGGQVTLNPYPHVRREPIGMLVAPIVSYLVGGWMIGWASAPYDPQWATAHPRRAALMSLAGPATNLALALAAAIAIRIGMGFGVFDSPQSLRFDHVVESIRPGVLDALAFLLSVGFSLNLLLFLFNLIPLPPLDGSGLYHLFTGEAGQRVNRFLRSPYFSFVGMVAAWKLLDVLYPGCHAFAIRLLYPGVIYR
jgi:Zn-dependent protease